MNQVYKILVNLMGKVPTNLVDNIKNILSIIGLVSIFYMVFFFSIEKPSIIKDSEVKVKNLETQITNNNTEIKDLEKENKKILNDIEKLEKELVAMENETNKYKKQYEKEVNRIRNASNGERVKLFTNTFK